MRFKIGQVALIAVPMLLLLLAAHVWGQTLPTQPPTADPSPGPFTNPGQLWLAVLMLLQGAFQAWWTSVQRNRAEDRQLQRELAASKLQADKEAREFQAREQEKQWERERIRDEREIALNAARRLADDTRRSLLEQTDDLKAKINENTAKTEATLDAANHLTEKVARAGALRRSDITTANGAPAKRRAEDVVGEGEKP